MGNGECRARAEQRLRDFLIGRFGGLRLTLNKEANPGRPICKSSAAIFRPTPLVYSVLSQPQDSNNVAKSFYMRVD